jgi:ABC-type transporter MlaC component
MKKFTIVIAAIFLCAFNAHSQQTTIESTVYNFYDALKAGDVVKLRSMIEDPLYSKVKLLLTKNIEYPEFLRNHYDGSTGAIESISLLADGVASVYFQIIYKDQSQARIRFDVSNTKDGKWKIIDQQPIY